MPIRGRPLLEYWFKSLECLGVQRIIINGHHHAAFVQSFVEMQPSRDQISFMYEPDLLGTAATIRANADLFERQSLMVVHADNLVGANLFDFVNAHYSRPARTEMTMMTFDSQHPERCGIVETDVDGVVSAFHEKVARPPGRIANGALYLLEPAVIDWIRGRPDVTDFSTQVIPQFVGRIATWHNKFCHRDIGTVEELCLAQRDDIHFDPVVDLQHWGHWSLFESMRRAVDRSCSGAPTVPRVI
jgi:mannose-1-phosphate guanylyltransferase